jgi:ABC-type sugar transport system ATPase subunit
MPAGDERRGTGHDRRRDAFARLENVSKHFGAVTALDDVTVEFGRGEVVGLIGANGAGKSTLMRVLAGATTPDPGRVLIEGEEVHFHVPRQALETGIARVPQELSLVLDQSVADNLLLGQLQSRGGVVKQRELRAEARKLLDRVGLDTVSPGQTAGSLTPVQQRLVTIAQALARNPRLLVLDEPTAALPTETSAILFPIVRELAAGGTAVIYITHRLDEVKRLCERVVAMRDGRVAGTLTGDEIEIGRMVVLLGGKALEEEPPPMARAHLEGRPVIKVRGLDGVRVHDVELEVHKGEILGVGGLYGAGRSELLRLIGGCQKPTAGDVEVLGASRPTSPRQAASRGVGYLAEGRGRMLFGDMSVCMNASIAILPRLSVGRTLIKHGKERSLVQSLAKDLQLKGEMDAEVTTLSGGNQQKVCLARWLLRESELLLLDEPTVGIDVHARAEIHRLLRDLAAKGTTVVVASAEPEELALLCDRVIVLVEGRLARELTSPFTADSVIAASYSGRVPAEAAA